jgi:hypothetical protein
MSYGKVKDTFWTDKKIQAMSDDAKMLALYLLTGPHRNMLGCMRAPNGYIMEDLKWSSKRLSDAIAMLCECHFIARDDDGWTIILNQLKHDPIKVPNHARAAIAIADTVPPESSIFQLLAPRLIAALEGINMASEWHPKTIPHAIATPLPSPLPIPSPLPSPSPPAAHSYDSEFDDWWKVYPRREGRGQAIKAFRAVRKSGVDLETLMAGATRYRDLPKREPKYTKLGSTWLSGECWRDEIAEKLEPEIFTPQESKDAVRHIGYARMIKKKLSPGLQFTPQDRSKMIAAGMVTMAECEAAGCAA